VLKDDEKVCHACGAKREQGVSYGETVSEAPRPRLSSRPQEERKPTSVSRSVKLYENNRKLSTLIAPFHLSKLKLGEFWSRPFSVASLIVLVVVASYLLGQYTVRTEVRIFFLDDKYYGLILTALHDHPDAYYSIATYFYRQLYAPTIAMIPFPLIFYIWILVSNIQDIKWLYFVFALAGTVASYFTITTITKQRLLAVLSAAWMAYFLETNIYLMFEYWAITVFLIGLAFFVSERYVPAAAIVGVATLIRQVFGPFMLVASVYYVSELILLNRKKDGLLTLQSLQKRKRQILINKKAVVWSTATAIVGVAYYLNGLASKGAEASIHFFVTFNPSILPLLFASSWFRYPALPVGLVIALALIGLSALTSWDQRIVMYASFASMIFLMLTAGGGGLITSWQMITQSSPRYVAMSIVLVNLFWLVGLYKIAKYPMLWVSSLLRSSHTSRG
jgi:hypothetical protein